MRRVSCFNDKVKKLLPPENGESKNNGVDRTQKAMISLLPHHPKAKETAKSEEKPVAEFHSVYDRFRSDLLTAMRGHNRRRRHEMCSLFQNLEGVIRIIQPQRVRYRVILAFNILKNHEGTVNQTEREQAMAGLFPNEDAFKEETLAMLGEYVSRIRDLTQMKQFHKAVVHAWTQVKGNPSAVEDPVVIGNCEKMPYTEPMEECFSKVFRSVSSTLGVSTSLFNDLTPEEKTVTPVEIQWSQRDVELAQMEGAQVTVASSSSSLQQQIFVEPEPTPSSHGDLTCAYIVKGLYTFFSDNHVERFFGLLKSNRSSDDLQERLIDHLGIEHFEKVERILQYRHELNDEFSRARKRMEGRMRLATHTIALQENFEGYFGVVHQFKKPPADLLDDNIQGQSPPKKIKSDTPDGPQTSMEVPQQQIRATEQQRFDPWAPSTSTAPPSSSSTSTPGAGILTKDDQEFKAYFKMVQMGYSKDTVRRMMKRDGVDPYLLDSPEDPSPNCARYQMQQKDDDAGSTEDE